MNLKEKIEPLTNQYIKSENLIIQNMLYVLFDKMHFSENQGEIAQMTAKNTKTHTHKSRPIVALSADLSSGVLRLPLTYSRALCLCGATPAVLCPTECESEISELEAAISEHSDIKIEEELGDILFSCTNLSRFLKKDSEKALTFAINKFIIRFSSVEALLEADGKTFSDSTQDELNNYWEKAKKDTVI